jgi:hypothetical protein
MQQDIINKYGKESIQNFWIFIENLSFDSKTQDAQTVRGKILKQLTPTTAEKYKDIGDELAFCLYRNAFPDKKNSYLYAAFEVVSKGFDFYQKCWEDPNIVDSLIESIDQFNNFSTVLPTEDDYFNLIVPSPQNVLDDFEEYDDYLESIGNKKEKRSKGRKVSEENE